MSPRDRTALLLLAMLAAGGGGSVTPAVAQRVSSSLTLEGSTLAVTPREVAALTAFGRTIGSQRTAEQDRALAEARRVAQSRDARYALAIYQLELGKVRGDDAMRVEALDQLIGHKLTPPAKLAGYINVRAGIAYRLGDFATAGALWTRLLEMKPNDPDTLGNLAQARQAQKDPAGAADLLGRAIAARTAAGVSASEILYRQQMSVANEARLVAPGIAAALALVRSYPTQANWRDALVVYRQLAAPKDMFEIDLLRLMRAAGALLRANEYQRMAQLLTRAGAAVEARAVLQEGVSRKLLNAGEYPARDIIAEADRAIPKDSARLQALQRQGGAPPGGSPLATADALLGMGRYAEAAPLYRAAFGKPGVNAAEANVRLGMALFLAGRRAEAEAAFRVAAGGGAATADPAGYADLAQFWLARLAQTQDSGATALRR
jgi:tetratricopeptide (TPR) repeat protein